MKITPAKNNDVEAIYQLINHYAELDRMLFREKADIYENLQSFIVAKDDNDNVIGCCRLHVIWKDLAEIKSLAVDSEHKGRGVGKLLVEQALQMAKQLQISKVMALTLESDFFKKIGFAIIDKQKLPMKVWSDCAVCPKQDHCDEFAMIKDVPL